MRLDLITDARTRKLLDEGQSLANWSGDCVRRSLDLIRRTDKLVERARQLRARGELVQSR